MNNNRFLPPSLLIVLSMIWGTSFILIKRGLFVFSAYEVALIRVVAAFLFLLPFALMRMHKLTRYGHLKLIASGLMGIFIPAFLFAMAQTQLDSSVSGIMNSLTPMWAIIIGALFCSQRLTKYAIMGTAIGSVGVVILTGFGTQGVWGISNPYVLMLVGATFLYGCNLNFIKFKLQGIDTLTMTSVSLFVIGLLSTIYLFGFTEFTAKLATHKNIWEPLISVVILGVMSTAVAVILLNRLIQITTPLYASLVTYLIPLVAILLGILDGEQLGQRTYIGMIVIIFGVYLSNKKEKLTKSS